MTAGYEELVRARKACRACAALPGSELRNGSSFDFDPDVVSHWSQWLGHQRPLLVVVGQDFSGAGYFQRNRGRDDPESPTNRNLRALLGAAGLAVGQPPERDADAPVYLTNAVLCMKAGGMAGPIRDAWVRNCTQRHLSPLLAHLGAPFVVAMGSGAWRAVRLLHPAMGLPRGIKEAAGTSWLAPSGTRVFAVGHCSGLGLVNRPWAQQLSDWRAIGGHLAACIDGGQAHATRSGPG